MTYTYFDIETSGLRHDDILLSYAYKKDSWEDERPVAVTLGIDYQNEKDLLRSLQGIVEGTLVMYNGETYRGGFDMPFLRTRMAACSVKWPFKGIPVLDLYPTVQRYFNTTTMRPKKKGEGETLSRDDRQDSVYSMFGGVNDSLEASDITGKEVVELYGKYLETGDSAYMAQIRSHNKDDVRQLEYIHSVMEGFLPKRKYTVDLLKEV